MNRTAPLVIDVQVGQFEGSKPIYQGEETLSRIASLIARARTAQIPAVYLQDGIGEPESAAWGVHPLATPGDGDLRIRKLAADAFFRSDLRREPSRLTLPMWSSAGCKPKLVWMPPPGARSCEITRLRWPPMPISNSGSCLLEPGQLIAWRNHILDGMCGPPHGFAGSAGVKANPSSEIQVRGKT